MASRTDVVEGRLDPDELVLATAALKTRGILAAGWSLSDATLVVTNHRVVATRRPGSDPAGEFPVSIPISEIQSVEYGPDGSRVFFPLVSLVITTGARTHEFRVVPRLSVRSDRGGDGIDLGTAARDVVTAIVERRDFEKADESTARTRQSILLADAGMLLVGAAVIFVGVFLLATIVFAWGGLACFAVGVPIVYMSVRDIATGTTRVVWRRPGAP